MLSFKRKRDYPMEKKKDWKMVSTKMDVNVLNRLDAYCKKTGLTRTKAMERIISFYLDQYDKIINDAKNGI